MNVSGALLHYVAVDASHWQEKYGKLSHTPDTWKCGTRVTEPKRTWKNMAHRLDPAELSDYFRRWVAMSEEDVRDLLATGKVQVNGIIEKILRKSGSLAGDERITGSRTGEIEVWSMPSKFFNDSAWPSVKNMSPDLSAEALRPEGGLLLPSP